jgi:hypothetical protein
VDLTGDDAAGAQAAVGKATVNRKRDAYMLTYVKVSEFTRCVQSARCEPHEELLTDVQTASAQFLQVVDTYEKAKATLLEEVEQRKRMYTAISERLPPPHQLAQIGSLTKVYSKGFHLVPAEWLHRWIKGDPSTFKSTAQAAHAAGALKTSRPGSPEVVLLDASPVKPASSSSALQNAPAGDSSGGDGETLNFVKVSDYLCRHGQGVDTARQEKFKVISEEAYKAMFHSSSTWQQLDIELTDQTFRCQKCNNSVMDQRQAVHTQLVKNERVLALIEATSTRAPRVDDLSAFRTEPGADSQMLDDPNAPQYWLSRTWLTQFKKLIASLRKADPGKEKPTMAKIFTQSSAVSSSSDLAAQPAEEEDLTPVGVLDPLVNTALFCEHKGPALNYNKRALKVSRAAWEGLCELFPDARAIAVEAPCCALCEKDAAQQGQQTELNRASRMSELDVPDLMHLWKRKRICPMVLDEDPESELLAGLAGHSHFAVDGKWVAQWRKYVQDPNFPPPPALTNAALRCPHDGAFLPIILGAIADGVRPGEHDGASLLVYKFQEYDLAQGDQDVTFVSYEEGLLPLAEVVTDGEWRALLHFHAPSVRSSAAADEMVLDVDAEAPVSMPFLPPRHRTGGAETAGAFSCRLQFNQDSKGWFWDPEVCAACLSAHEAKSRHALAVYTNTIVKVVYLRDESEFANIFGKALPGASDPPEATAEGPRRSSKRTRGKRLNSSIIADSTDSLAIVRLKVCQAFSTVDLPPNRQKLFDRKGAALLSHTLSLGDCNVNAGDTLYVMEGEGGVDEAGDWSYMDCFNVSSAKTREHGFSGTLLTQSRPQNGGSAAPGTEDGGRVEKGSSSASRGSSENSAPLAVDGADTDDPDMAFALRASMEEARSSAAKPPLETMYFVEESQDPSAPASPVAQVRDAAMSLALHLLLDVSDTFISFVYHSEK